FPQLHGFDALNASWLPFRFDRLACTTIDGGGGLMGEAVGRRLGFLAIHMLSGRRSVLPNQSRCVNAESSEGNLGWQSSEVPNLRAKLRRHLEQAVLPNERFAPLRTYALAADDPRMDDPSVG